MSGMRSDRAADLQAEQTKNGEVEKEKRKEEMEKNRIRRCV